VQALAAGCRVLMEKPMVTNADHAYKLKQKVEESGKTITIGYKTPCNPKTVWLREQIRSGGLGRLEMVSGFISQNWMKGTTGKWRQHPRSPEEGRPTTRERTP
jgi:predicted dehydrogenase